MPRTTDIKQLVRDLNAATAEAKEVRGQMPKDLWDIVFQLTRRLSLGIHDELDIGKAQLFLQHFTQCMEKNKETIESVKQKVDEETKEFWKPENDGTTILNPTVETPIIGDLKSQIIH